MKREYLFRGKRADNKEWVEGSLLTYSISEDGLEKEYDIKEQDAYNTSLKAYKVIPETVGQYIWLKDKNNTKAFVGDIFIDAKGVKRTIMQNSGGFVTESNPTAFGYNTFPYEALSDGQNASWFSGTCKIIGNIFDNINLLTIKTNI